jgi:hypothetical protein
VRHDALGKLVPGCEHLGEEWSLLRFLPEFFVLGRELRFRNIVGRPISFTLCFSTISVAALRSIESLSKRRMISASSACFTIALRSGGSSSHFVLLMTDSWILGGWRMSGM